MLICVQLQSAVKEAVETGEIDLQATWGLLWREFATGALRSEAYCSLVPRGLVVADLGGRIIRYNFGDTLAYQNGQPAVVDGDYCTNNPACVVNDVPVPPGEVPGILDGAEELPPPGGREGERAPELLAANRLPPALVSRLYEMAEAVVIETGDYRKEKLERRAP